MKIHILDQEFLGNKQAIASYLVEGKDGHLLFETGPASVQATLEKAVTAKGFSLDSIRHVFVTHIHLDHSGGAGHWAERGAKIYVHQKGAKHLIDPSRLLASAERIYQDKMQYLWGETRPVAESQVVSLREEMVEVSGHQIKAWDTPGHAGHHLAYQVEDVVFTGDVAACRIPGWDFVSVPAPPPEFNLELWMGSIEKLRGLNAQAFYLTHFGKVEDPAQHLLDLERRLLECAEFVRPIHEQDPETLSKLYQAWDALQAEAAGLNEQAYEIYEKANPSFMSATGLARYWRKR